MFLSELRILRDPRIVKAIHEVENKVDPRGANPGTFLNIISVILLNLPEILANLNNPIGLIAVILKLLNPVISTPAVVSSEVEEGGVNPVPQL